MELAKIMHTLAMGQTLGKEESPKWLRFAYTAREIMLNLPAF
jgi:hypothetical protein|tara:strand:+ start:4083 stop:4208 length:126 start_codon:yes stop_codon:yes gene_type:complete